jgi:hypothetical protein
VFVTIFIMAILTVAIAAFAIVPHIAKGRVIFANNPDRPAPFGSHMSWLAVRSRSSRAVVDELGLVDPIPCNWNSGVGTVYDNKLGTSHVFVSPPVNGWTFVVGLSLPHPVGKSFVDKFTPVLMGLGRRFVEVQYFFSYPPIDFFAWARLIDGQLIRGFAITDEGIVWKKGRRTKEERSLGLRLYEFRGVRGRRGDAGAEILFYPTEDHIVRLAEKWSLDPTRLDANTVKPGTGYIALAPPAWRTERIRRRA